MPQKIEILFSSKIFRLALKIFRAAWYYIVYNIYFALCAKDRISLLLEIFYTNETEIQYFTEEMERLPSSLGNL